MDRALRKLQSNPSLERGLTKLLEDFNKGTSRLGWEGRQAASNLQASATYSGLGKLTEFTAPDLAREMVQEIGNRYGCHECGAQIRTDNNQPWIGDHQPPTNLSTAARAALGLPTTISYGTAGNTKLYPQCSACSTLQSALIKALNGNPAKALTAHETSLVGNTPGQFAAFTAVDAVSDKCSGAQGNLVQAQGVQHGCHSCTNKVPAQTYHADHNPPVWSTGSKMEALLTLAKSMPALRRKVYDHSKFTYLPHCPRCSSHQGGVSQKLKQQAEDLYTKLFG